MYIHNMQRELLLSLLNILINIFVRYTDTYIYTNYTSIMLNCRICLTLRICTNYLKCKLFVITKHFWDVIRNIIVVLMQVFLHKIIRLQFTYRAIAINTIKVRAQNIVFYELYSVAAFYHRKINFQTYIIRLEKNNVLY